MSYWEGAQPPLWYMLLGGQSPDYQGKQFICLGHEAAPAFL